MEYEIDKELDREGRVVFRTKQDTVKRPLDRFVICRTTDTVIAPGQLCPQCGKPLLVMYVITK